MTTAVAAPDKAPRPLYVLVLEQAIRDLDALIAENMPAITADHPQDFGISTGYGFGRERP